MKFALLGLASVQAIALKQTSHQQVNIFSQQTSPADVVKMFDADENGTISWTEVENYINGLNIKQSCKENALRNQKWVFEHIDTDNDGEVSEDEIHQYWVANGWA